MTGIVTAFLIERIISGSDIRATPPLARISDYKNSMDCQCRSGTKRVTKNVTYRHALKGHNCHGTALLGDSRLLNIRDVCA